VQGYGVESGRLTGVEPRLINQPRCSVRPWTPTTFWARMSESARFASHQFTVPLVVSPAVLLEPLDIWPFIRCPPRADVRHSAPPRGSWPNQVTYDLLGQVLPPVPPQASSAVVLMWPTELPKARRLDEFVKIMRIVAEN